MSLFNIVVFAIRLGSIKTNRIKKIEAVSVKWVLARIKVDKRPQNLPVIIKALQAKVIYRRGSKKLQYWLSKEEDDQNL